MKPVCYSGSVAMACRLPAWGVTSAVKLGPGFKTVGSKMELPITLNICKYTSSQDFEQAKSTQMLLDVQRQRLSRKVGVILLGVKEPNRDRP